MSSRKLHFKNDNNMDIDTLFCSICYISLTDTNNNISTTKCSHLFCTTCIIKSMKYNNTCPLCRTELTSPNKKFSIKYKKSKRIVQEELQYYKSYISDNIDYVMSLVEYHTNNEGVTPTIKDSIHRELNEVIENFGMGICLNINTKFASFNIYNTDTDENNELNRPRSPIQSPQNSVGISLPPIS